MRYVLLSILTIFGAAIAGAQPVANFSALPLIGCPPMVVSLTDHSTGNPTSWSWTFTGGLPARRAGFGGW